VIAYTGYHRYHCNGLPVALVTIAAMIWGLVVVVIWLSALAGLIQLFDGSACLGGFRTALRYFKLRHYPKIPDITLASRVISSPFFVLH
jgi:hypothetical protein